MQQEALAEAHRLEVVQLEAAAAEAVTAAVMAVQQPAAQAVQAAAEEDFIVPELVRAAKGALAEAAEVVGARIFPVWADMEAEAAVSSAMLGLAEEVGALARESIQGALEAEELVEIAQQQQEIMAVLAAGPIAPGWSIVPW